MKVSREGVEKFKKERFDIIIVDTSGRHQQEKELFAEMVQIQQAVTPDQTIMVLDASIGQAAEAQSKAFKESADFGAIIITKTDGHAAGGGAISAVAATRTPIVFIGTGEHMLDLERFAPQAFVSKLLGMGDMQGLVEHVQSLKLDQKDTMKHIQEGIFTVRDLRDQLGNIMKMGPLSKMAGMIPGLSQMMGDVGDEEGSMKLKRMMYTLPPRFKHQLTVQKLYNGLDDRKRAGLGREMFHRQTNPHDTHRSRFGNFRPRGRRCLNTAQNDGRDGQKDGQEHGQYAKARRGYEWTQQATTISRDAAENAKHGRRSGRTWWRKYGGDDEGVWRYARYGRRRWWREPIRGDGYGQDDAAVWRNDGRRWGYAGSCQHDGRYGRYGRCRAGGPWWEKVDCIN